MVYGVCVLDQLKTPKRKFVRFEWEQNSREIEVVHCIRWTFITNFSKRGKKRWKKISTNRNLWRKRRKQKTEFRFKKYFVKKVYKQSLRQNDTKADNTNKNRNKNNVILLFFQSKKLIVMSQPTYIPVGVLFETVCEPKKKQTTNKPYQQQHFFLRYVVPIFSRWSHIYFSFIPAPRHSGMKCINLCICVMRKLL